VERVPRQTGTWAELEGDRIMAPVGGKHESEGIPKSAIGGAGARGTNEGLERR